MMEKELSLRLEQIEEVANLLQEIYPQKKELESFLKDFIKLIIWLASWIIWFSVPIFRDVNLIQNQLLFKLALWWCILAIIFWLLFFYQSVRLSSNVINKTLEVGLQMNQKISDSKVNALKLSNEQKSSLIIQSIWECGNIANHYLNWMGKKGKWVKIWDPLWHLCCWIFLVAIILLFISLL